MPTREFTKEEIIDKYFDGQIKSKDLRKFKQKTPEGNFVSGYLCTQKGPFLSSMVLLDVEVVKEGYHIEQHRFIRGMPKQHYYDKENWSLRENDNFTSHSCYEKLDGTCLMLYTLYDEDDNLIEIVPRTRGMAVAANHIIDMFKLVDQARIREFYKHPHNYDYVLMFELYGILNRHEITYHRYYIDIKLTGITLERDVLDKNDVLKIAYNNHFTVPDLLFEICCFEGKWHIHGMPSRVYPYYWYEESIKENEYDSLEECIEALSNILEIINNNYAEKNNHIALEGVVINSFTQDDKQRYVKIKPESVLRLAKLGNGIPKHAIRKESYKYFDEYGVEQVKKIYNDDKFHYLKYIQKNLLEEFPENLVLSGKTSKKIERVFFDLWEKKTPDTSIQNICQELGDKYSDKSISEVMRIFSKEYPQYKQKSRTVYSVLKYIIKEE